MMSSEELAGMSLKSHVFKPFRIDAIEQEEDFFFFFGKYAAAGNARFSSFKEL